MKKLVFHWLLAIVLSAVVFSKSAQAADLTIGAKVFNANCTACHMGGNNVIIAAKTLKKEALDKYGMNSLAAIVDQVTNGRNAMPAFKGRLNATQIEEVAAYVLEQSQKGW